MNNLATVSKYFEYFSSQNSELLGILFSEDAVLCDWNVNVAGKSKVIESINAIFDSVSKIEAIPKFYFINSTSLFAIHVEILINNETKIDVIDVIEFNYEGKISKVIAFKLDA